MNELQPPNRFGDGARELFYSLIDLARGAGVEVLKCDEMIFALATDSLLMIERAPDAECRQAWIQAASEMLASCGLTPRSRREILENLEHAEFVKQLWADDDVWHKIANAEGFQNNEGST